MTVLWLPVLAVLGAVYTAVLERVTPPRGDHAAVTVWLVSSIVAALAVVAFIAVQAGREGGHEEPALLVGAATLSFLVLGACLGAATLVARRRTAIGAGGGLGTIASGTAVTCVAWLVFAVVTGLVLRLAGVSGVR